MADAIPMTEAEKFLAERLRQIELISLEAYLRFYGAEKGDDYYRIKAREWSRASEALATDVARGVIGKPEFPPPVYVTESGKVLGPVKGRC